MAAGEVRAVSAPSPVVEIVVPAHNEAHVIEWTITRLHHFLEDCLPYDWRLTVVDNASTDGTRQVAERTATAVDGVRVQRLERKGRGGALRSAWSGSSADIVAYMDADLSTGLDALIPLVAVIASGGADVAIGSRLAPGARVDRRLGRDLLSRGYNLLLRAMVGARFRDAQCGFKAVRGDVARALLPLVEDDGWFFDTELLVVAQRSGLSIVEVPVRWIDDSDSRVEVLPTVLADLKGAWRLLWRWRRLPAGALDQDDRRP